MPYEKHPAQITNEAKSAKIKKLHTILKTTDELDMEDVAAAIRGLMDHLHIVFDDYDSFFDQRIREIAEERGVKVDGAWFADEWADRENAIDADAELTAMYKFSDMEDYFFDLINTKKHQELAHFAYVCRRYLVFNRYPVPVR